jgi:hypothetical protein
MFPVAERVCRFYDEITKVFRRIIAGAARGDRCRVNVRAPRPPHVPLTRWPRSTKLVSNHPDHRTTIITSYGWI